MATFVPRFLRQLKDVLIATPADGEVLTYDSADQKWKNEAGGGGGGPPTGTAGGVLGGTYPNPSFAADMATQAELDAHLNDTTDAHDASAISILDAASDFAATEVEGALAELQTADEADEAALASHLADTTDAHDASAISFVPTGTIGATDVQSAIAEAASEAVTDLSGAVILAPASSARNVIQPTSGSVIAAIVKAHASQSVDLTQWQKSDGTKLATMGVSSSVGFGVPSLFSLTPSDPDSNALFVQMPVGTFVGNNGDIFDFYNELGAFCMRLDTWGQFYLGGADGVAAGIWLFDEGGDNDSLSWGVELGYEFSMHHPTPADADVRTGMRKQWYDGTIGADKWRWKARDLAGTLTSGISASEAYVNTATALLVPKSLYDANTILAATTDDTPAALTMGASTILARLAAGNIVAATPSQLRTLLSLVVGTDVAAQVVDAAVGTGSLRTLGTGATQAAVGSHVHAASAVTFSPTGTIAATDVQTAIAEVASEAAGGPAQGAPAATGRWYRPTHLGAGGNTASILNKMQGRRIELSAGTLDRIATHHLGGTTSGEVCRLGIYNDSNGRPGTLLLDAGTVDLSTGSGFKTITISQAVLSAWYWLVSVRQGPSVVGTLLSYFNGGDDQYASTWSWEEVGTANIYKATGAILAITGITGALPTPFGTATLDYAASTNAPQVGVRYA